MQMNQMITSALDYAERGIPVFPIRPKSKEPFKKEEYGVTCDSVPAWAGGPHQTCDHGLHGGFYAATTDPLVIKQRWTAHPDANIGGATGVVFDAIDLDQDASKGKDGEAAFKLFEEKNGAQPLGEQTRTGRGGRQIYVKPTGLSCRVEVDERGIDYKGLVLQRRLLTI
jgi:putative DNA primase/helicase